MFLLAPVVPGWLEVDDKGKTTTLTKEQVVRGKRLFIAACASCHVGGGTRTNQNVGLAIEELSGAQPNRATVEGLVDYLNNPTTYDGLKDPFSRGVMCSQTGFDTVISERQSLLVLLLAIIHVSTML